MAKIFNLFPRSRMDQMKARIKLFTSALIVVYLTAFAFLLSPYQVQRNLSVTKLIIWATASMLATFLVLGDLHNWLDKRFFKEREKVDEYIRERIVGPCKDLNCSRADQGIMDWEKSSLINLFYEFITPEDTERERAFSYFTDYFVTVNYSAISVVAAILLIPTAFLIPEYSIAQYVIIIAIVTLPLIFNLLRRSNRRKLKSPANSQTDRILAKQYQQLRSLLPKYRHYNEDTKCDKFSVCSLKDTSER